MTQIRFVALDDIADVSAGNPAPQDTADFSEDGEPFVRMHDVGREHHTRALAQTTDKVTVDAISSNRLRRFPAGTLLIPKSGASINLNHRALLARDAYVVSHLATVIPDTSTVDPDYLYFWSLTYDPRSQAQTTSLPSLPTSLIKATQIPLPPLAEQRHIVDLLRRAEGIVRLRHAAQQKAAELIPAIFLDLFGDPATNSKCWPVEPFANVMRFTRYGPRFPNREYSNKLKGARILRTTDIQSNGTIVADEAPMLPMTDDELQKYTLAPNTIVITRTGATIGKVALYESSKEPAVAGAYLIEIRLTDHVAAPYILHLLLSSYGQQRLTSGSRAVAQPNINVPTIAAIPVPLPPLDLQHQFAAKAEAARRIIARQAAALATTQTTFNALLHGTFAAHEE